MRSKQRKTLEAIFVRPTLANIPFRDIESLLLALGASLREGDGSRIRFELMGESWYCHRPHPDGQARRYQVEQVRELLILAGVHP